ncbi:hypothetical protein R3P38DRAFT_2754699 [Favolaschia claudopus]|uniref:Uncharacterized protein n=1 Tax=Favolaschia claudopus TaxID=2862362 RepID=A0AAV9Z040_9AGAR
MSAAPPSESITEHGAMFLGCIMESFGYGILTVMVIFTVRSLLANKQTRYPSPLLLTVLACIWLLSTGHWITNVYRAYQAFIAFPGGPLVYYNLLSIPSYTARNVLYCTLVITSDAFAVYRVFRVWNGNWYIAALPMLMVVGSAAAGYGTTYQFSAAVPGAVFNTPIIPWGTAWYAMNLATNTICTLLVAFRIIRGQSSVRNLSKSSGSSLRNTLIIILESAAIYSASTLVLMTTTLIGTNASFLVLDITVAVVGITFTLIILRVSLGVSSDAQSYGGSYGGNSMQDGTRYPSSRSRDLTVNVSRLVEVNPGKSYSGTGSAVEQSGYSDSGYKMESV